MVKLHLKGIKAAIFDLNGTMIADQKWHREAWRQILKKYGIDMMDEFYRTKISGGKNYWILKKIFPGISDEENNKRALEKEALYREIYKDEIKEVPGLTNLLNKLADKKIKLAMATTASKLNRDFAIEKLGLENVFELTVGDEDVKNAKPDPEILNTALVELGGAGEKDQAVIIGDSDKDIYAGKAANIHTVLVLHPENQVYYSFADLKKSKPDFIIESFAELNSSK